MDLNIEKTWNNKYILKYEVHILDDANIICDFGLKKDEFIKKMEEFNAEIHDCYLYISPIFPIYEDAEAAKNWIEAQVLMIKLVGD